MENNNKEVKTVIILGMHRSGTSMVAGILNILGVNMGEKLVGKAWSNPLGHFENREFLGLNNQILETAGGDWRNPPEQNEILTQREKFSGEIKNLIEKSESEIWGWKDPRTSLTIELYLPYIKNPYFLLCYRNPQAVAESLLRRDKTEINDGIKMCEIYNQRIDVFFRKHPDFKKIKISYESVIKSPREELEKIIKFLEIRADKIQYQEALTSILSPERKRKSLTELKREEKIKKIYSFIKWGITHPWEIPHFIYKKFFTNKTI